MSSFVTAARPIFMSRIGELPTQEFAEGIGTIRTYQ
jgi:hypothetical protein